MAVEQFTFPQSGDADDAEHFAAMIGRSNATSYVETGLSFTYNNSVPSVGVSQGKGYIRLAQDVASSSGEDILEVNHVVQVPAQTVSLTDNAVNYIYLEPNFGDDDNGNVSAYTSTQPGSALLIGTIDTGTDEVTELARNPELSARRFSLGDDQNLELGANDDFVWYYDSSEDRLALDNDAGTRLADVGDANWQMEVPLALNNNSLDDVASIDGGGDKVQFDDSIDLTGQNILYDLNAGVQNLVSFPVDSSSPAGTEHSYDLDINGTSLLKFYAESDGAGSVQNAALDALVALDLNNNAIDDVASIDGGGNAIEVDDDLSLNNNVLGDVASIDGNGDAVIFNDDINANSNDIANVTNADVTNLNNVSTVDGGGTKVQFDDFIDLTGQTIEYDLNAGVQELVDMEVDSTSPAATEHSYDLRIDSNALLQVYAESDGTGATQNSQVDIFTTLDMNGGTIDNINNLSASGSRVGFQEPINLTGNNLEDGANIIWNATGGYIEQTALENDSVTITAGDGLKSGGSVALGSSVTVDIEPADFAGTFLSDDGADNLTVDLGAGLENDGSGSIRVDEDFDYTFTSAIDFSAGLDTQGNVTDGTQVIWDATAQEIPDSAMGSIDNATLTNSSVTITAGDGLKSGGTVALGSSVTVDIEPADFAGTFLSDDGADNLTVDLGDGLENDGVGNIRVNSTDIAGTFLSGDGSNNLTVDLGAGVENDGAGNIRVDEDYDFTFTSTIDFGAGLSSTGAVDMNSNQVTNLPAPTATHHAARKGYVDGVAQGLDLKDSVQVASQSNIDLTSATDPNPIDGYTLSNGERILLKAQTDNTENGIYVANTATDPTTWTRAADFDEDSEATNGAFTFIENGTEDGNTSWIVTTDDPITLGTTGIVWAQFSQAGEFSAGDGLSLTGQTFAVVINDLVGSGLESDGSNNARISSTAAGNGLKGGSGSALAVEPADIAGMFLSDDGSDNLQVNVGAGLENDGAGGIRVDEDFDYTFTSAIDFSAGLDVQNDITDGTQVIWDASLQEIPDSAMGSIANSTLANSSVTVTAGTSLTGGGSISLGGSATINHGDTSTQGNIAAAAGAAITDVNLDGHGHVTSLGTTDFDGRFVNDTGDTISGTLTANGSYAIDARTGNRMGLPTTNSDPTANIGDIWYRSDLD